MFDDKDFYFEEIFKEYYKLNEIQYIGKTLGKGAFGIVKEIKVNNCRYAGKLSVVNTNEEKEEESIKNLRGSNIIKIVKICKSITKLGKNYRLIIMERAVLNDLGKLNTYFHDHNLLKLIYINCFDEVISDTVLRFFSMQIIKGLEIMHSIDLVHFDIKLENILILNNLILKISDFSILRKVEDDIKSSKIPGGTSNYLSPEYLFSDKKVDGRVAKKQDYFALGCSLFLLKFGIPFSRYKDEDKKDYQLDSLKYYVERNINYLKSRKFTDNDFINFMINLIQLEPEKRSNMEQIIRSKWLRKNLDCINEIVNDYDDDNEKLLVELQKKDFMLQKKEFFESNTSDKNIEKIDDKNFNKPRKRNIKKHLKFKKKIKIQ